MTLAVSNTCPRCSTAVPRWRIALKGRGTFPCKACGIPLRTHLSAWRTLIYFLGMWGLWIPLVFVAYTTPYGWLAMAFYVLVLLGHMASLPLVVSVPVSLRQRIARDWHVYVFVAASMVTPFVLTWVMRRLVQ